jgi:diacylglycerol kinase
MHFITKNILRLSYAFSGILFAVRNDYSFRLQFYIGGIFIILFLSLVSPLSYIEYILVILSYILVLITELQNSAFESAIDHLHPELHDKIGRSKDMAAGAVLLAGLFLVVVTGTILYTKII